ncbi:MAG: CaiB/BaiF CoA-transferase family protein [Syntrophobacteraceae bacterium]
MESQPMHGVRVLDLTRVLAGPFATMILGDLGADILKVEPLNGDESREWPPMLPSGESGYFLSLNRNKRSITLNLKDSRAKEIVRKMARRVDIVVENFTPGVVEKLGIGYEALKLENPALIYCSISGFGQQGPYRNKKAYDPIIQGMTGLMSITGERGRLPVKVGIPITDLVAAFNAVIAIQAAYAHRLRSGEGQYIDVALYDSVISLLTIMATEYFVTQKPPERWGLDHVHRVPARAFRAGDGKFVQVAATNDVMYPNFCRAIGLEWMIDDPRFNSNANRLKNRDIIMPILEEKMLEHDSGHWLDLFEKAGLPCGPILDIGEVFSDPNIQAREMLFQIDHPVAGKVNQLGFPYKFSSTPARAIRRPPLLGEHSEEVLGWLGYSRDECEELKRQRVI